MIDAYSYFSFEYKPLFVYGSLMRGLSNHGVLAEHVISHSSGYVKDVDMFAYELNCPLVFPGSGQAVGELFYLAERFYPFLLSKLDKLEDFKDEDDDSYKRIEVEVSSAFNNEKTNAWMYMGQESVREWIGVDLPPVFDGDWKNYLVSREFKDSI